MFSVSVFTLILYLVDANDVFATIMGADVRSIVVGVGITLGAYFLGAIRLKSQPKLAAQYCAQNCYLLRQPPSEKQ